MLLKTDSEREKVEKIYAHRKEIADAFDQEFEKAIQACGRGAKAYAVHVIRDKENQEPERRFYCCQREDGLGWIPKLEDVFPRLRERSATRCFDHPQTGDKLYYFRFSVGTQPLTRYVPQKPEELIRAAKKRKQKARAKELKAHPLFAESIKQMHEQEDQATC